MRTIRGKVAAVVSDFELAPNIGADAGVKDGDTVTLYRTVKVNDPDSKEELGAVQVPKLNLRIVHVQERLSTAQVTDMEVSGGNLLFDITRVRRFKTVTTELGPSSKAVRVSIGEPAIVEGPEGEPGEARDLLS